MTRVAVDSNAGPSLRLLSKVWVTTPCGNLSPAFVLNHQVENRKMCLMHYDAENPQQESISHD
jgi:hypothetical protein